MPNDWRVYQGRSRLTQSPMPEATEETGDPLARLPEPPPWRRFGTVNRDRSQGLVFQPDDRLVEVVNMALYLRRPLLITGKPGSGKSSLARAIATELELPLLKWPITTRSTLQEGLYSYDVVRRLEDAQIYGRAAGPGEALPDAVRLIGRYLKLGPLGTAMLPAERPPVLLIDEIDKSDIDLPNDLLNILEEGEFEIREIRRHQGLLGGAPVEVETSDSARPTATIPDDGRVRCTQFPIIVMTSNGERDFPPAFLRRCLRHSIPQPDAALLKQIVAAHLGQQVADAQVAQIEGFVARRRKANDQLATDQLLNLIYLLTREVELSQAQTEQILGTLLQSLEEGA
ncbi:MAG: MoxR family ATPase [Roseiflexaceae bacterium]